MDLHAWITQQVDAVEVGTRAELEGRQVVFEPALDGRAVRGTITAASYGPDGLTLAITQYEVEPRDETPAPVQSATAVLRRCEADRRILARHRIDPVAVGSPTLATACNGCGAEWVQDSCDPFTENVNDCPELLDLGRAHGLTDEILAGLDRPQPPKPTPTQQRCLQERARLIVPITTSDVPAALRGPHWKP
jgi:hypothetical protein